MNIKNKAFFIGLISIVIINSIKTNHPSTGNTLINHVIPELNPEETDIKNYLYNIYNSFNKDFVSHLDAEITNEEYCRILKKNQNFLLFQKATFSYKNVILSTDNIIRMGSILGVFIAGQKFNSAESNSDAAFNIMFAKHVGNVTKDISDSQRKGLISSKTLPENILPSKVIDLSEQSWTKHWFGINAISAVIAINGFGLINDITKAQNKKYQLDNDYKKGEIMLKLLDENNKTSHLEQSFNEKK